MPKTSGPQPGVILGEEAKPPFAVLPDPSSLFLNRARRFAALAPAHELGPYLAFLAVLTGAQHAIQTDLPVPALPPLERIGQALEHGMPPIARALHEPDDTALDTLEHLLTRLGCERHCVPRDTPLAAADTTPRARDDDLRDTRRARTDPQQGTAR
jgi:FdhE protein